MSVARTCPECGAALPADAPKGFCPQCLVRAGRAYSPTQAAPSPGPLFQLPRVFGDYELLEEIARGGMGVVYKARQVALNRIVAVKMILSGAFASREFVQRFRAEAETVARLRHPNIVAIHEVGERDGQHYFSMDYVPGRNLAELVREHPLPAAQAARYLRVVAQAVHYAHEHDILHRDLKPANILIDLDDEPRVTDFGLAKRLMERGCPQPQHSGTPDTKGHAEGAAAGDSRAPMESLTLTGQVLGSPSYAPPEQAGGRHAEIGPASDVYSLGAVLYHLLTGRPPFAAGSLETTLALVLNDDPVSPRALNPSVPRDLETVCLKCLEKEPARRYRTAQELADELGRFQRDEPICARPVSGPEKLWRWSRRNPRVAGLSAALILVFLSGFIGVVWQLRRARAGEAAVRLSLYIADLNLAHQAVEARNVGQAVDLLSRHRPKPGQPDLRSFEWGHLWQLCHGDELLTLRGHSNEVLCLSFSPDGRLLATGSWDATVRIWDAATYMPLLVLTQLTGRVWSLAFTLDGKTLITLTDKELTLWDTREWKPKAINPHAGPYTAITVYPRGRYFVTARWADVALWDLDLGLERRVLPGMEGQLAFSPDGRIAATGCPHGIKLWDFESMTDIGEVANTQSYRLGTASAKAITFSPDGRWLAFGGNQGDVELCDVAARRSVARLTGHTHHIFSLAFSPDGKTLASASVDQTLRLWDVVGRTNVAVLRGHIGALWHVAYTPDGKHLVSASSDAQVKVWKTQPQTPNPVFRSLRTPWLSADGKTLAIWGTDAVLRFIEMQTGSEVNSFSVPGLSLDSVGRVSPDGRMVSTHDSNGPVQVWSVASRKVVATIAPLPNGVMDGWFAEDSSAFVTEASDHTITLWSLPGGGKLLSSTGEGDVTGFSRFVALHGQRLLTRGPDFSLKLLDAGTGAEKTTFNGLTDRIEALAFSRDGRWLAAASRGGTAVVWDAATGRTTVVLRGWGGASSIVFSPDGQTLAVGSNSRSVRLWNVRTWQETITLRGPTGDVRWLRFSNDGNTLIAWGSDQNVMLWRAAPWSDTDVRRSPAAR